MAMKSRRPVLARTEPMRNLGRAMTGRPDGWNMIELHVMGARYRAVLHQLIGACVSIRVGPAERQYRAKPTSDDSPA
jgi:hypothetical protein